LGILNSWKWAAYNTQQNKMTINSLTQPIMFQLHQEHSKTQTYILGPTWLQRLQVVTEC